MRINRKVQPPIQTAQVPALTVPEKIILPNGLKLYVLNMGELDIFKLEIMVEAGRPHEWTHLSARCTAKMIREGCRSYSAEAFAEHIDFYGASLSVPSHMDIAAFQLFTLTKHAPKLIPAVAEALMFPAFGKRELNTFLQNTIAELAVEMSNSETIAYRKFTEYLYGSEHPYGYNSTAEMYKAIEREDLVAFHEARYHPHLTSVILSGRISNELIKQVSDTFGSWTTDRSRVREVNLPEAPRTPPQKIRIKSKDGEQAAIKLGRRLFSRHHPDFMGMGVLNAVLGGYFGSRLMTNIREKKGYTYNIYSSFDVMRHDGFFYVASEVNKKFVKSALTEIYAEIDKLRNEPIPDAELEMVRNYLSGMMLLAVDGPLNQSNLIKSLIIDGMEVPDFELEMKELLDVKSERLMFLANKWLDKDQFWEVIV